MDAHAVLTRLVADVARDLLAPDAPPDAPPPGESDEELAGAFHAAVGAMDPVEYESLLLTLPAEALRALAVAGYVTTTHLLYACGARSEVPGGVADYLAEILLSLSDEEAVERFTAAAWFGYAYGVSTRDGVPRQAGAAVLPEAAEEARTLLALALAAAGFPPERADALLERACRVSGDSLIALPPAYVQAGAAIVPE